MGRNQGQISEWKMGGNIILETGLTKAQKERWILAIIIYGPHVMDKSLLSQEQKLMLLEIIDKNKS
jgi:hypothetical protein